jgi:hypothetical protein
MKKVINYAIAYGIWIIDMGLAFWFAYLCRTDLLSILALRYKEGQWQYPRLVTVIDKSFLMLLGLGWLAFIIIVEEYNRPGIQKGDLLKRIARINGPLFIAIFVVDLILFWLQGIGSYDLLRWLILAAELGIGIALLVWSKTRFTPKPN